MSEKKILDVTCGDRTIWFQKNEPHTIYCDKRREELEGDFGKALRADGKKKHRHLVIDPDVQCDFTDLPFEDESFDIVINRHGDFNAKEIFRVLKSGGIFITQQVGAENDRELVDLIFDERQPLPFPEQYLTLTRQKFESEGFEIAEAKEAYRTIKFFDVGALVWFARIIEWEFLNFSVDKNIEGLIRAQKILCEKGELVGSTHRFFMVAIKRK